MNNYLNQVAFLILLRVFIKDQCKAKYVSPYNIFVIRTKNFRRTTQNKWYYTRNLLN